MIGVAFGTADIAELIWLYFNVLGGGKAKGKGIPKSYRLFLNSMVWKIVNSFDFFLICFSCVVTTNNMYIL